MKLLMAKGFCTRQALLLLLVPLCFASGCAVVEYQTGVPPAFQAMQVPSELEGAYAKLEREGERDWVLNLQSVAMAALWNGNREIAKKALDEAILQIEIIYGDNPQARRARSLWFAEESKIFKGDPYERSMIYFYRGVLYMQDKDWDNARAAFRSAQIQDAFAEEQQFTADWVIFDYLIGVCEIQLGDYPSAKDAFEFAARSYSDFPNRYSQLENPSPRSASRKAALDLSNGLPEFSPDDNLLVITQHGRAPRKVAEGRFKEYQAFRPGGATDTGAAVFVDDDFASETAKIDSVYYQAVTRGGREVDRILGRQALIKGTTADTSEVAMIAGGTMLVYGLESENDDAAAAGLAALAAGGLAYGFAALVKPEADLRHMRHLPDALGVYADRLSPGRHQVRVQFKDVSLRGFEETQDSVPVYISDEKNELNVLLVFPPPRSFIVFPGEPAPYEIQNAPVASKGTTS